MFTYQQEFLDTCLKDMDQLLNMHWDQIALNKDKIKLNPDFDAYRELEACGKLKMFTVRHDGNLVGYFVVIVGRNIHYKDHLFAQNDVIYVHPDYRKGSTGANLINFAEGCLREDGVSVLNINTKVHKPFDNLMDRLGFNLIERVYSKYLGD